MAEMNNEKISRLVLSHTINEGVFVKRGDNELDLILTDIFNISSNYKKADLTFRSRNHNTFYRHILAPGNDLTNLALLDEKLEVYNMGVGIAETQHRNEGRNSIHLVYFLPKEVIVLRAKYNPENSELLEILVKKQK